MHPPHHTSEAPDRHNPKWGGGGDWPLATFNYSLIRSDVGTDTHGYAESYRPFIANERAELLLKTSEQSYMTIESGKTQHNDRYSIYI